MLYHRLCYRIFGGDNMKSRKQELEKRIKHDFTHLVEPDWNNQGNKRFLNYAIRQIKKAKLEVLRELKIKNLANQRVYIDYETVDDMIAKLEKGE